MNTTTVLGLVAAILTTSSFLPQALKTIRTKNTSGISLFMYSLFSLGTLMWLIYGWYSDNLPIMVANAVTLIFAVVVLFYKIKFK